MTDSTIDLAMQYAAAWEAGEPVSALRPRSRANQAGVRLLTIPELASLPRVSWLVEGVLPAGGNAMLYGRPGTFKSLLAIDIACAVATGRPWHGRVTHEAPVLYIAGEGRHGLKARFEAHQSHHGLDSLGPIYIIPEPLSLLQSTNAEALLDALALRLRAGAVEEPLLLIVDTVRKCTPGGEENDSGMVSEAMVFLDRLRRDYPLLTALMLHHPGAEGKRPRGSSAWEADTDTVLKAERAGRELRATLTCEKQRDAEPFEALDFSVQVRGGGLVLGDCGSLLHRGPVTAGERNILEALASCRPEVVGWTRWKSLAGVSDSVLSRARAHLLELGFVSAEGPEKSRRYMLTDSGTAALSHFQTSTDFQPTSKGALPSIPGGPQGPRTEAGVTRREGMGNHKQKDRSDGEGVSPQGWGLGT